MKILITGGAGFIGSHIADLLIENNHEIIIIDNLSTGKNENINEKSKFYNEDLSNHEKIKEILLNEKPEIIYHLAAQLDVRKSLEDPVYDAKINIINALNLLEIAIKIKLKHFIFSSTGGAIYGETENIPTTEENKELPVSPYGCAKLSIEKYLNYYSKVYGLKYTALRYSNVYGPRQNYKGEGGVIAIFLNKMLENKTPIIFGGKQTRDFVYVKDVANANLLALNDNRSDNYNVGTGTEISINQLFQEINNYFNNKFIPEILEMRKGEQKRSCISSIKIKENLKWFPKTDIKTGLKETFNWYKSKLSEENIYK
jgi:UDP-glucose 4-epimerase